MGDFANRADYRTAIAQILTPAAALTYTDTTRQNAAITAAARYYSRFRECWYPVSLTGDGSTQSFAFPQDGNGNALWTDGYSQIQGDRVEVPTGDVPPTFREADRWYTYTDGTDWFLVFLDAPGNGDGILVPVRTYHFVDDDESTIPPQDGPAVAQYAAAILLDQEANYCAEHAQDGSFPESDSVDLSAQEKIFRDAAVRARAEFSRLSGIPVSEGENGASGGGGTSASVETTDGIGVRIRSPRGIAGFGGMSRR